MDTSSRHTPGKCSDVRLKSPRANPHRIRVILIVVNLLTVSILLILNSPAESIAVTVQDDDKFVRLCQQLADAHQAVREYSFAELEDSGIEAFETLYRLRDSSDLEQRMAAQRLLRLARIEWPEDLPLDLRQTIERYETYAYESQSNESANSQSSSRKRDNESGYVLVFRTPHPRFGPERRAILEMISRRGTTHAAHVLALVARYELDPALSRFAALKLVQLLDRRGDSVIDGPMPGDPISPVVTIAIGRSERTATSWIAQRLADHDDSQQFSHNWSNLVVAELNRCNQVPAADHFERNEIAIRLAAWVAGELVQRNQLTAANDVAFRIVASAQHGTLDEVVVLLGRYGFIDQARRLARRFPDEFLNDPPLLYRLAAIELAFGDVNAAKATVLQAHARAGENSRACIEYAVQLRQFGYTDWSEHLFRTAIEELDTSPIAAARARLLLAEQQFESGRHDAAAKTLQILVATIEEDKNLENSIGKYIGCSRSLIKGRLCLFQAHAARASGDDRTCRARIIEGLAHDSRQTDLLIAAFHCSSFDTQTRRQIDALVQSRLVELKREIESLESHRTGPGSVKSHKNQNRQIAAFANSYAWLVVNTRGDLDLALEYSKRANRLAGDIAAYLDTEARLRFACGDQSGAIRCQQLACEIQPASQLHKQQLAMFRRYRAATLEFPLAGTEKR